MEVRDQLLAPAVLFPRDRSPCTHWGGFRGGLTMWRKDPLSLAIIESQFLDNPARRVVTILTELTKSDRKARIPCKVLSKAPVKLWSKV
jgi:hypothetical protein